MQQCMPATQSYQSMYSSTSDSTTTTIILLSVVLPLQCLCFIGFCIYSRYKKKIIVRPQPPSAPDDPKNINRGHPLKIKHQLQGEQDKKDKNQILDTSKKQQKYAKKTEQGRCEKLLKKINKCMNRCASKNILVFLSVISILLTLASLVMVGVSILPSQQALTKQFPRAECTLNRTVSSFINGDDSWIGLSNMVPNLTKLSLNLNTRVKATKNSILSLVLNGTNATFPIGFPNATRIPDVITNTNITATSIQTFIDAKLRQWLFMNSTLSSIYRFPICQNSTISNIPHPLNDGQTIELNYMVSICNNLTQEVNDLVANGRAVDQLLALTTSIENNRVPTQNNLSLYNNTVSGLSSRANQYTASFSTTNIDVTMQRLVPYILLGITGVLLILTLLYISCQFYRLNKYLVNEQDEEVSSDDEEDEERVRKNKRNQPKLKNRNKIGVMVSLQNISISAPSQLPPSQVKRLKEDKMKSIMRHGIFGNSNWTHAFNAIFLLILLAVGSSSFLFNSFSNRAQSYCNSFGSVLSGQKFEDAFSLSASQMELLNPVQSCLSNSVGGLLGASGKHFLQTTQTSTYLTSMEQLYKVSAVYNSTTPVNVLNSISLQQIEILKSYLLHMETMPVKSADFTISNLLSQLNTYTNGSSTSSRQKAQCGASLLRDQYVYNVVDCNNNLINYTTQTLVSQARCLQIPTWDGSGGSKQADLNDAQHTIELNASCPTVYDFYNGSNLACFLGKRLDLLRAANCTQTASEYNRRMKNLIKFSVETASYTNSYLQNLRNYFGVYSVLSTNLTEFFNGANTSAMLNQFGTLSNNLINKTSCSYVTSSLQAIYEAYCPTNNNIAMLLHDSYLFVLIAFGLGSLAWGFLLVQELLAMVYVQQFVIQQQQSKQNNLQFSPESVQRNREKLEMERKVRVQNEKNEKKSAKASIKKHQLEVSEQTLRNEDRQQEVKISRIRDLDLIQDSPRNSRHLAYLEGQDIYRIKEKYEKEDSRESRSSHSNTEQHEPFYQYDNLQNQQTGKKLIHRQQTDRGDNEEQPKQYQNYLNIPQDRQKQQDHVQQPKQKQTIEPKIQNQDFYNPPYATLQIQSKTGYHPKPHQAGGQTEEKKRKPKKLYQVSSDISQKQQASPPLFFGNKNQDDSRIDDFASKESYGKQRKVQSKAEVRRQTVNVRQEKSVKNYMSKIKKQATENQRLKVIQLDGILKQSMEDAELNTQKYKSAKEDEQPSA